MTYTWVDTSCPVVSSGYNSSATRNNYLYGCNENGESIYLQNKELSSSETKKLATNAVASYQTEIDAIASAIEQGSTTEALNIFNQVAYSIQGENNYYCLNESDARAVAKQAFEQKYGSMDDYIKEHVDSYKERAEKKDGLFTYFSSTVSSDLTEQELIDALAGKETDQAKKLQETAEGKNNAAAKKAVTIAIPSVAAVAGAGALAIGAAGYAENILEAAKIINGTENLDKVIRAGKTAKDLVEESGVIKSGIFKGLKADSLPKVDKTTKFLSKLGRGFNVIRKGIVAFCSNHPCIAIGIGAVLAAGAILGITSIIKSHNNGKATEQAERMQQQKQVVNPFKEKTEKTEAKAA